MIKKINFPISRFSIILGLFGFGKMWILISDYLNIPKNFGEILLIVVALIWLIFILIYSLKTIFAFEKVVEEIKNPIQNSFFGLIGVATLLISIIIKPYSLMIGEILFFVGIIFQLFYGIYITQKKWVTQQEFNYITPALYLPTVAGNFVSALACGIFEFYDLGYLFFGMGLLFWLSIESIIMNRLYKFKLEEEYQNTLGIMVAPPAIAAMSWMSLHNNKFDLFTMILLGYGLIQVLIFIKTLFFLIKRPFNLSYWAFSFGFTTLTNVALLTLQDKNTVLIKIICCSLVVITNIALFYLIFNSLKQLYKNNIPNKFKNELQ